jgi:hypothetical protein
MIGDRTDMVSRLRALLPARWFADTAPVLDATLTGFAALWTTAYEQLEFVRRQTRIATASGSFLDMIATDFFGTRLCRRVAQDDTAYRRAIGLELRRVHATREALRGALQDLTGRSPLIFEPARAADTKAWGVACGWGEAGAWGSLRMPFQCLVTAFRQKGGTLADVVGWGGPSGGWGGGAFCYASLEMMTGRVTDEDIAAAVAGAMPVSAIAWMRISN